MSKATLAIFTILMLCCIFDRALLLENGKAAFNATDEKRWFDYAYRRDDLPEVFGTVASPHDQPVTVIVPPPAGNLGWWRIMALYYLPQVDIRAVKVCDECPANSKQITLVPYVP